MNQDVPAGKSVIEKQGCMPNYFISQAIKRLQHRFIYEHLKKCINYC